MVLKNTIIFMALNNYTESLKNPMQAMLHINFFKLNKCLQQSIERFFKYYYLVNSMGGEIHQN